MNPRTDLKVSLWNQNYQPKKGTELKPVTLYSCLIWSRDHIDPDRAKGTSGSIFPYKSTVVAPDKYVSDGVVFVDFDKLENSVADTIFNSFSQLSAVMPNLLAVYYSYSHNLHFVLYDENLSLDASIYKRVSTLYTAALAQTIRKTLNIDLRQIDGCLDTHNTSIYQRFFLNHTPDFKWNDYVQKIVISKSDEKKLRAEYFQLFREEKRIIGVSSTEISGKGDTVVDKNFSILGNVGYMARTVIVAASYYHFNCDIDMTRDYLISQFANAQEMNTQLESMIRNGHIEKFYSQDIENVLFSEKDVIFLRDNEYLNDKYDLEKETEKYIYIQSNTNTGKTEFVKRYMLNHEKSVIIQMTKALRDGKRQGIENFTYSNWTTILDKNRVHTTIDGFNKNFTDLTGYTVFVDESHLLEDYVGIRYEEIKQLLLTLKSAERIIFLSATPKSDINIYDFKRLVFKKIQDQELTIHLCPITLSGKAAKLPTKYSYIVNEVEKRTDKNKCIIFSNKNQKEWKMYGLDKLIEESKVTVFNSMNKEDEYVKQILDNNKLVNDITLATNYMGCGVEVKGESELDMYFCIDEGITFDFITQAIGRPRDAKRINIYLYYSREKWKEYMTDEELSKINSCFDNLVVKVDDQDKLNILAARMINLFDEEFNIDENRDKLRALKISYIMNNRHNFTPYDVDLFKTLPYKSVKVVEEREVELVLGGVEKKDYVETEFREFFISLPYDQCREEFRDHSYEELLNKYNCYRDRVIARKDLTKMKNVIGIMCLDEAIKYFGSLEKADKIIRDLKSYIKYKTGSSVIQSIEGLEKNEEDLKKSFEAVEMIFVDKYLEKLIDKELGVRSNDIEIGSIDDVFAEVAGVEVVEKSVEDCKIVKGNSYKEAIGTLNKSRAGKNGGKNSSPAKKVYSIVDNKCFNSCQEASKFYGKSINTITSWIKSGKLVKCEKCGKRLKCESLNV